MTQEEKAKAYDEAIERAKKLQETCDSTSVVGWCEYIFPKLKESEDERIRDEIIDFLKLPHPQFVGKRDHEKWISWLEKQRERKTWSEEDEHRIELLKALCEDKFLESAPNSTMYEEMKITIGWLKLLRPQNKWKPSDEQIGVIEAVINNRSFQKRHLDSLYEQLKKLKEE